MLKNGEIKIDYVDAIKTEYTHDIVEGEDLKRNKLNSLRDMYVVGLINNSNEDPQKSKFFHGDATKTLKIRVDHRVGQEELDKKNKVAVENIFEIWQEKTLKQLYKVTDKKYELIAKNEYESSKITRIETKLKNKELIIWSTDRLMDYYLYCEKGVTEGVFIKVDVFCA